MTLRAYLITLRGRIREALVPEPLPGSASAALMASLTRSAESDSTREASRSPRARSWMNRRRCHA